MFVTYTLIKYKYKGKHGPFYLRKSTNISQIVVLDLGLEISQGHCAMLRSPRSAAVGRDGEGCTVPESADLLFIY